MFLSKIDSIDNLREVLNNMVNFIETCTVNEDRIFNSRLIACELITNVLVHSKCAAKLQVSYYTDKIEIIVESEDYFNAEEKNEIPDATSYSGRGLFLVNTLCDYINRDGKKTTAIIKI
jgi:anti-sigma regulatory factor (Ser/Thr protein kinase)